MGGNDVMRDSPQHITNLHDLPVEVLSEVALYLDFEDILSWQQTSKRLREAIDAHMIWLTFAQEYCAHLFHLHRPESGALSDLNTTDLRNWIQRRLIVDRIWRKARTVWPRIRMLPNVGLAVPRLVPGGRWLLVGFPNGRVCYCDLDSKILNCVDLIPPLEGVKEAHQSMYVPDIDIDHERSALEFKILLCGTGPGSLSKTPWLHIWQAGLEGRDSLRAERIASVPSYFDDLGFALLSLKGHLLARAVITRPDLTWIEVYWWKQCSSTSVLRTAFPVADMPDNIYVIGDDKILCTKPQATMELYFIPKAHRTDVEDTVKKAPWAQARDPFWSHTFSSDGRMYCSPLYRDGGAHRLVVSTDQGIWGLMFLDVERGAPSVTKLSTFSNRWAICVPGIHKAYALYGEDTTGVRIGYNWDEEGSDTPPMSFVNGRPKASLLSGRQPAFDEENGRFVWRTMGSEAKIMVVDFSQELNVGENMT